jgi:hypothetical protein
VCHARTIFYPGKAEQFLEAVLNNPEKVCPDARGIILKRLAVPRERHGSSVAFEQQFAD